MTCKNCIHENVCGITHELDFPMCENGKDKSKAEEKLKELNDNEHKVL